MRVSPVSVNNTDFGSFNALIKRRVSARHLINRMLFWILGKIYHGDTHLRLLVLNLFGKSPENWILVCDQMFFSCDALSGSFLWKLSVNFLSNIRKQAFFEDWSFSLLDVFFHSNFESLCILHRDCLLLSPFLQRLHLLSERPLEIWISAFVDDELCINSFLL